MATVLWCYLRNAAFDSQGGRAGLPRGRDLTGQANHLGVTIEADIIKQKLPEDGGAGFTDLKFGRTDPQVYTDADDHHPIDLSRYQVANCYMGRVR